MTHLAISLALLLTASPPRVASTTPDLGADGVDPALTHLRVQFDQDMSDGGHSFCGGGPMFPRIGEPSWEDARTILVPVTLEAGREYALSVNCDGARNFRSAAGERAEPFPVRFKTAPAGGARPLQMPTPEEQAQAAAALKKAIMDRYSYRDLRAVDWDARFAKHQGGLESALTRGAFAMEAARLLGAAADLHMTVRVGIVSLPTHRVRLRANCNTQVLSGLVPKWTKHNDVVITGRFDDGIGYIAILTCPGNAALLQPALDALETFRDCRALIVDLRNNTGGSEATVQRFAGCFVREPSVYSLNDFRDASSDTGYGDKLRRRVEPTPDAPAFAAPVAVLVGPAVVSSAESLALMLKCSPRATLIGATTHGSSGNPRPVELPNGVTIIVPTWRDYLPDGTLLEGRGITPDIEVNVTEKDLLEKDPVLEAALSHLRK